MASFPEEIPGDDLIRAFTLTGADRDLVALRRGAANRLGLAPDYRRRIQRQLNQGEALHALRRFLFFAHEGKVQRRQPDQQTNQVLCLNWVTNAIVTWNTVYMNAAIERLRAEGRIGRDIDLGHLSPALYGHVNPYGKYRFEIEGRAATLRPLSYLSTA